MPDSPSLRSARQAAGLSLRQAETFLRQRGIDVSERTLGNYERNETSPSDTRRSAILAAYASATAATLPGNPAQVSTAAIQKQLIQEARDRGGDQDPSTSPEASGDRFPHAHVLPLLQLVALGQPVGRISILVEHQALVDVGLDLPLAREA
ncbi:MAG: helix-turn-helix transcriptional regulator [Bacteroidota bacterium]